MIDIVFKKFETENKLSKIDLMEIGRYHVGGGFMLGKKSVGFCFDPTQRNVWTFSPTLRGEELEAAKRELTALFLKRLYC